MVCAGGGNDVIDGGTGRDELFGQDGSDIFQGADLARDRVIGGSRATDVATYAQVPTGVTVDESTGVVHQTGAGFNGAILGVERVVGTPFADVLIGRPGNDSLRGGAGDDTLDGRGGSNQLDGGTGRDTLSYATSTERANVNLGSTLVVRATTEDEITGFESVIGSPLADRLVGTSGANELEGRGGDDVIKGKGGDDILLGGGADDVLFPGAGDDFVDGGTNDPVTSSGEHGDLVSYQGDALDPGVSFLDVGLYFFGPTNQPPYALGVGDDELAGIESVRGVKSGRTHVQGNDGPNVIIGGDTQDFLVGRGGNDLIYGLRGGDILWGDYAAGSNPSIFGDDYLDGGAPTGATDADRVHGDGGDDTCTGALDDGDHMTGCETTF
ncbi:MAG: hypothetical protein H6518_06590 [Microthrixaceae bacterium]|nr:hypothetical protein [Microthrixaceae bacterium]